MGGSRIEPHPLDFDWRFTDDCCRNLAKRVFAESVLACGVPSIVEELNAQGCSALLVDRNPFCADRVIQRDISRDPILDLSFPVVVMDPPWYPEVLDRWLTWAAQHLPVTGGKIWTTIWPTNTRPAAEQERKLLIDQISRWADVKVHSDAVTYNVPAFELAARKVENDFSSISPWWTGDLLEINVKSIPKLAPSLGHQESWIRFLLNNYQLALRIKPYQAGYLKVNQHPLAQGWIWRSVSRRAEGREYIDLWSSHNEVGIVINAPKLKNLLSGAIMEGVPLKSEVTDIAGWTIPNPPFYTNATWMHHE